MCNINLTLHNAHNEGQAICEELKKIQNADEWVRTVAKKFLVKGLCFCAGGLDILKSDKYFSYKEKLCLKILGS